MAADEKALAKLQADFESGRNPKAYIPLAQALRRLGRLPEAMEVCQRGLINDSESLAGRLIYAKILCDLGKYEESLREVARVESSGSDATGLIVTKARCQVRLHRYEDAEATLSQLDRVNPMDTGLGILRHDLRDHQTPAHLRRSAFVSPPAASAARIEEMGAALREQLTPMGKVHTFAVVDLDSGKSVVDGRAELVTAAETYFQETAVACDEMGQGRQRYALLEFNKALVLMFRRGHLLAMLAMDPQANLGKVQHRVNLVLQQYLPAVSATTPRPVAGFEDEEAANDTTPGNTV